MHFIFHKNRFLQEKKENIFKQMMKVLKNMGKYFQFY